MYLMVDSNKPYYTVTSVLKTPISPTTLGCNTTLSYVYTPTPLPTKLAVTLCLLIFDSRSIRVYSPGLSKILPGF